MLKVLFAAAAMLCGISQAKSAVLLDVGGANSTYTVRAGTAVAVSFDLNVQATNVTITAPILCIGCTGSLWFNENAIGPGSAFTDTLASVVFNSSTPTPFFTFPVLNPGFYAMVLAIDSASTGSAIWTGSTAVVSTENGATRNVDWDASTAGAFPPRSNFTVMFGEGLNYTVSGTVAAETVPEPGTALLLLAAVVGLATLGGHAPRRATWRA